MTIEDIEAWIKSLPETERLEIFKSLSQYLSINELKSVMSYVDRGEDLFKIHSDMGLIKKYYVDLIRIHRLFNY